MTTRSHLPSPEPGAPAKLSLTDFTAFKREGHKAVCVTAYDAPSARLADQAGVDLVLVGDSAAMVMLGLDSTVPATMDEMLVLCRAVARGARHPLVIRDVGTQGAMSKARAQIWNRVRIARPKIEPAADLEVRQSHVAGRKCVRAGLLFRDVERREGRERPVEPVVDADAESLAEVRLE